MSEPERLLVACLCADWCGTCRDYRAVFEALEGVFAGRARFTWVDIEDDPRAEGVDVDNFPTLLLARGDRIVFYGTVLPHAATAKAMVERALRDELPAVARPDVAVSALPGRLRLENYGAG